MTECILLVYCYSYNICSVNTSIDRSEYTPENIVFLEEIFWHEKCAHFSVADREQVIDAYILTQRAHKYDTQKSGTPYMNHIDGVIRKYLDITRKNSISASDICTVILHDVIEDHPEFIKWVLDGFWKTIYRRVLGVTKPSAAVLNATFWVLTRSTLNYTGNLWESLVPYFIGRLTNSWQAIITHHQLHLKLVWLWRQQHLLEEKSLKNYRFLWMIADLSEDDFEIKCADRIDNLNNLVAVDMSYVKSNLESTEVYILKARALWREDLVLLLEQGMRNLTQRKKEIESSI